MKTTQLLWTTLAAAGLLVGCSRPPADVAPPQPTVNGAVVSFPGQKDPAELRLTEVVSASERPVELSGRLVWDEDATARVYAPYAGRVERLMVQVGQSVGKGAALAQISAAEMGQAQADLQRARTDERITQRQLERARSLVEVGAVARKDLESAEALVSPVAGVVVERNLNPGLEVRPDAAGPPLFVVSDPRRLWVMLDLDETLLARIKPGARIELTTAAWPDEAFAATVLHVGEWVDPASRTVKVRARVDNPKGQLRAEMFVKGRIEAHDGLPLVPADAVFVRGDQLGVFVSLGQGRYERRFAQLRTAGPQWWHVVQGLKAGDKVVVGGALFLNQLLDAAQ